MKQLIILSSIACFVTVAFLILTSFSSENETGNAMTQEEDIEGVWNLLYDFDSHPHQANIILKVSGTKVYGKMWADDVFGTWENGILDLEFPYSSPYLPGSRGMARFTGKLHNGVLSGEYDVCGWQGPFRATKFETAPAGGAYPVDGLWNCMVTVAGGPHSVGTTTSMLFSLKQYGTEITGRLWEDDVSGTMEGTLLHLEFPWTDPYFGYSEKFVIDAGYGAFDDVIFGTGSWGEDIYTISATRVPEFIQPGKPPPRAEPLRKLEIDSEIDGVWNLLFDPDGHAHMNNLILQVIQDTLVTGRLWEDQVYGTYKNGVLELEFPYSPPYLPGSRGMARFTGRYEDGKLKGRYDVVGWQGNFEAVNAILTEPGGASPVDGLWNGYVTVYSGPSANGATFPLLINLKVDGQEISGRLWENDIKGKLDDRKITLDFPYADPFYPGEVNNFVFTGAYGAYDDIICGTYTWGEDMCTMICTRVPLSLW